MNELEIRHQALLRKIHEYVRGGMSVPFSVLAEYRRTDAALSER